MPDSHKGLPEIITAFERNALYFGVVSVTLNGVARKFEFDIDQASYQAIKRLINLKPYGRKRGLRYHYYYSPGPARTGDSSSAFSLVHIERENQGKEFEIELPESLIEILMAFVQAKGWKELSNLREFK